MGLSYADSGVDREKREEAKKFGLLESTYSLSKHGKIIKTPFNTLYPIGNNMYHVKTCDGIGTKVLIAEAVNKHDTIGQDAIAMVVNDCIRCGARPLALTNVIDIKKSEPGILTEIQKGLYIGAEQADCPLIGGETADVPELLNTYYHINTDCVGEVTKDKIITGEKIKPGDVVIGFRSSGPHSNGISLLRKALFKSWGGRFDFTDKPEGFDKEIFHYALEPTKIYVKDLLKLLQKFEILGAVHVTGDAYLKFKRTTQYGFEFDNFNPQPIFKLIQECGSVEDSEMFKTFNMGWGFAIIVNKKNADDVLQEAKAEKIGTVTEGHQVVIKHEDKKMVL